MEITSVNNEKVKYWEKLKLKKYRDQEHLFLIEDDHLVKEALKFGIVKEIITLDDSNYDLPTYKVNEKIMKLLSSQVTSAKIIAVCNLLPIRNINGNVLVLDNIQDPGNLGTMIRSAVAFNFDTIVLSDDTVDLYNPKVIRSSEGMIFHLNIIRTNIIDFLNNLDSSYLKITTDVVDGKDIRKLNYKKVAIVIGNEGKGVKKEVSSLCDEKVHIKMSKETESLNASITASILMYEVNNG